ncbi:sulfatase-like hydrolase/transferase [Nocardioides humilatus]|uniref:sulfatase-like hydrolase/transferase n=1 Tax=Nocardioides humilatus TaxID=2607660 RepID=UPI00165F43B4|nr:sulfatase-like hydrolase/transferase [Nocardioides humilatus]
MRSTRGALVAALIAVVAIATTAYAGTRGPSASSMLKDNAASGKPNIVLIVTDDMRTDELQFMPKTWELLVEKGVEFTNAISPHPLCCPARAELVSGQYGQNSGVQHNEGPWGGFQAMIEPDQNIGRWLHAVGYQTSYHGKYLNGYEHSRPLVAPEGWTTWDAQLTGIYTYNRGRFFNGDNITDQYVTHTMVERSGTAIAEFSAGGAPFFTVINHVAPHVTLAPPHLPVAEDKYADAYSDLRPPVFDSPAFNEPEVGDLPKSLRRPPVSRERIAELFRARVRSLLSVDDAVAETVAELDKLGELDNTYIIFTSDNGYALGEHHLQGKNYLVDEVLDVPLVIRGPGYTPGTVEDMPVTLVDVVATIADWSDAVPGQPVDGLSIERMRDHNRRLRDTILVQTGDRLRDSTPGWAFRGVSTDRYLFGYRAGEPSKGILFDRRLDPDALRNRFWDPDYRRIRDELTRRTEILSRCSGGDCSHVFGALPPVS